MGDKSDRSNMSKADSLNRARIINDADDLKDDEFEEYKQMYESEQKSLKVNTIPHFSNICTVYLMLNLGAKGINQFETYKCCFTQKGSRRST